MYQQSFDQTAMSIGPHESQLSSQLRHLHCDTMGIINRISNGESLKVSSLEVAGLERRINENMSAMRLLIKDFELVWEDGQDDEEEAQIVGNLLRSHKAAYEGLKRAIASAQVMRSQLMSHPHCSIDQSL